MKKKNGHIDILIAEDSATQAEQLQLLLEEHNYKVTVAANGKAALELLARHQPELVISDVVMPELDGYGLCKAIKSDDRLKHIPVMLVTTLSDPDDVIRGLECGADNFIRKPYEEKYLLSRINYLLMNVELRKNQKLQMGMEIHLGGEKHFITAERQQILDLLVSTYEQAVHINSEIKEREKELAQSNQVLLGLNHIAEGLNGAVSEKVVTETALRRALELPGVQAGWMFLRDGETGFRLAGTCNLPSALDTADALDGDCICQQKLLSGELDMVANIIQCKRLAEAEGGTEGLCCHASVPLWLGPDRLLGVMNLAGSGNGLFSDDELKVLYGVGNQVAVALERARLHENLERLVDERTLELRASEARLGTIIEAEPECVKIVDAEGSIVQMNAAGLAMLDADSLEQVQGRRITDFVSPEQSQAYRAFAKQVLDGNPGTLEFEITSLKGRHLWLDTHAVPLPDSLDGRPQILAITRDVTKRKHTEARLKLFRTLLDQSSDAIEVLDPVSLRFLDINETGCRVLGYSREELLSMSVSDIDLNIGTDALEGVEAQLEQTGSARFETVHRRKDGSTFPVEVSATIIEIDKPYLLSIARDITQRKESETRITRLNHIYTVLSGINTTIVRVRDEDELFREACRIAVEHGQFTFAWIGRFDADSRQVTPVAQAGLDDGYLRQIDLIADDGIPGSCALTTQALSGMAPAVCNDIASDERMAPWRDAALGRGYRSVAVFPLVLDERPCGVFALYASEIDAFDDEELKLLIEMSGDISYALDNLRLESRREQAEAALVQLNESLEHKVAERTADLDLARREADAANHAKSAFLATMSHEIRTPMNGVLGMVEILAQGRLTDHQAELIDTIRESATTLLGIIDDILDFSKIEAGRLEIEHTSVCVPDIVEGLCNSLVPLAAAKGVKLSLFISPDIPERLLSDDVRLRQLLYNLVGNAIKFSAGNPEHCGRVDIRVEPLAKTPFRLSFRIIDNGIGMKPEMLAQLFSPFTQAEVDTTRRFGGTGLGLAICKRLTDLMQGEIAAESTFGAGSTFTVTLPFTIQEEQPEPAPPPLTDLDCIVVTDDNLNSADIRAYLEHAGARVAVVDVTNPASIQKAAAHGPVVLIQYTERQPPEIEPAFSAMDNVRLLYVTHGRRRRARVEKHGAVSLDGDALRRHALVRAVAVAAGRASPEVFQDHNEDDLLRDEAIMPPTVAEARTQGRLILIAEDDDLNQRVILQQLRLLGYAGEVADNGGEALRLWREGRYALLLTDLHMPEMDGYTLAQAIRQEERGRQRLPIIALTANALRGEKNRAKFAGMDSYLTKPVPLRTLREMLETWLPQPALESCTVSLAEKDPAAEGVHLVDVNVLKQLVGDDRETVQDFLTEYLVLARKLIKEIQAAFAAGDVRHVSAIAHKLKSSSRSVGALVLGDLCAGMENAGREGDRTFIAEQMQEFEATWSAVENEISDLLADNDQASREENT